MSTLRQAHTSRAPALLLAFAVVFAGASSVASRARADEGAPAAHRAVPDYDGRPDPSPTAVDAVLWVPRIVLAPLYLFSEYVVRRPLGWLITELERIDAFQFLLDLLTYGPNREMGVFPTAFFDFGFSPSFGVYGYWRNALARGNQLSLHGAIWGDDWIMVSATDRYAPRAELSAALRLSLFKRPDQIFGGVGWQASSLGRARYGRTEADVGLSVRLLPWQRSRIESVVGYRSASFTDRGWQGEPSFSQLRDGPPVGFETGYAALRVGASLVLDTRDRREELSRGGVRVEADLQQHVAFGAFTDGLEASTARWLRWGGALRLMTDFLGRGRVLALEARVAFVSPIDGAPVPFTELLDVGGRGPLTGFRSGEIYGQSLASARVEYVWPVWAFLDATIHVAVGNAFASHLSDFEPDRLRLSFGVGLLPRWEGEHLFQLTVAAGTEPFARGTEVSSFRFALGATTGT